MKIAQLLIRLLLPVTALVLLVCCMLHAGEHRNWLLAGGLLCSALGLWLNTWLLHRERKEKP
ncbi:MAG: hypothetical protein IJB81_03640 [Clostridia bacterium]|nr:hypothetical protein [Clostridia bacterium]